MNTTAKNHARVGPRYPHLVVLVGATGDLARRKLLPGLFHLSSAGFIPGCRVIGVSLDEMDADGFRKVARALSTSFDAQGDGRRLDCLCREPRLRATDGGVGALRAAVDKAEQTFTGESRRLHYLSVPPSAALSAVRMLGEANLVERPESSWRSLSVPTRERRVIECKPARGVRRAADLPDRSLLGKEPAQNILAFRFANGLLNRSGTATSSTTVQIDVPETLGLGKTRRILRNRGRISRHGRDPSV